MVMATTYFVGQIAYFRSPRCKLWYQRVSETITIEPKVIVKDTQLSTSPPQKRQRSDDEDSDDNPAQFRRVRLRYWDQNHELGSSLAHNQGGPIDISAVPDEPNQTDWDYQKSHFKITEPMITAATSAGIITAESGVQPTSAMSPKVNPSSSQDFDILEESEEENRLRMVIATASNDFEYQNSILSRTFGTSYMPNAQLMYNSDKENDVTEAELPALNARIEGMSQSSQPAGGLAKDTDAFAFSVVNSNPPPLPPSRYIDDITAGSDPGWAWGNDPKGGNFGKARESARPKSNLS